MVLILILGYSNGFAKENASIIIPIWKHKVNTFSFPNNEFTVSLNFNDWSLNPVILNKEKEIFFNLDSNVEILKITELDNNKYVFCFSALGFEQFFIYDITKDKIIEPFFDLKNEVSIRGEDFNNLVLFGDTWNSDKGITPNQIVSLYLFSTAKQQHLKIAEKKGSGFNVKVLDDCTIEYEDQNGKIIHFGYSDWIIQSVSYEASSFLIEGKAKYEPENLSTIEGLPWASKNGYGINDIIKISFSGNNYSQLAFYNGFQSESRPDLYKANSRAKKIKIKNLQTGLSKVFIIQDIPDAQEFPILDLFLSKNTNVTLEITILEVYPGDRFKDLCIQAIIPIN